MKKTAYSVLVATIVILIVALLLQSKADYERIGCQTEWGAKIARFHRDCLGQTTTGYFRIPDAVSTVCNIYNEAHDPKWKESSDTYKLRFHFSPYELGMGDDKNKKIVLHLIAGEEGKRGDINACQSRPPSKKECGKTACSGYGPNILGDRYGIHFEIPVALKDKITDILEKTAPVIEGYFVQP